jgi:hypothetical protein
VPHAFFYSTSVAAFADVQGTPSPYRNIYNLLNKQLSPDSLRKIFIVNELFYKISEINDLALAVRWKYRARHKAALLCFPSSPIVSSRRGFRMCSRSLSWWRVFLGLVSGILSPLGERWWMKSNRLHNGTPVLVVIQQSKIHIIELSV